MGIFNLANSYNLLPLTCHMMVVCHGAFVDNQNGGGGMMKGGGLNCWENNLSIVK